MNGRLVDSFSNQPVLSLVKILADLRAQSNYLSFILSFIDSRSPFVVIYFCDSHKREYLL